MDTMRSLNDLGIEVMGLFKQARSPRTKVGNVHTDEEWPHAAIAAQSDRFELWSINIGLFVPGHGSLDYRLREAESLTTTVGTFLINLNTALMQALDYWTSKDDSVVYKVSDDTESDSSEGDAFHDEDDFGQLGSDMDLLLDGIKDPIDRLYKLAVLVRNPSSRFASSKALSFRRIDPESGVDLLQSFAHFDYDYVTSVFLQYRKSKANKVQPNPEPSTPETRAKDPDEVWEPIRSVLSLYRSDMLMQTESFLVRRIADANVRRRRLFAYWRHHRDKLSQHSAMATKDLKIGQAYTEKTPLKPLAARPIALSVTTASCLPNPSLVPKDDESDTPFSEYAPSVSVHNQEIVDFPPPPKVSRGDKFFECPYCFTSCPGAISHQKTWKAHLIHDMRPYVCTYKDCKNPAQLYDTHRDWIEHESTHRESYRCSDHENLIFSTRNELKLHFENGHNIDSHSASEISAQKVDIAVLPVSDRDCPICTSPLKNPRTVNNHIALHLERLAMFSLPRDVDEDQDKKEDTNSDKANVAGTESQYDRIDLESDLNFDSDIESSGSDIAAYERDIVYASSSHESQENSDDAEELNVKLIDTLKGTLGTERLHTLAEIFHNLGWIMYNQGNLKQAAEWQERALGINQRLLEGDHPDVLSIMHDLANVYHSKGRWKEAEMLEEQASRLNEKSLGMLHPSTIYSMNALTETYMAQEKYEKAANLAEQVLKRTWTVVGEEQRDTLTAMANLTSAHIHLGEFEAAATMGERVLEVSKAVLGEEHPNTLKTMAELMLSYVQLGRLEEAATMGEQALGSSKVTLGEEHPETQNIMLGLAPVYIYQGRSQEAAKMGKQVIQIRKATLGEQSPDTLAAMSNLGEIYASQNRSDEAEEILQEVLRLRKSVLGREHPDTLASMSDLAHLLHGQARYEEANPLMQSCYRLRWKILGLDHPSTVDSRESLRSWSGEEPKPEQADEAA